MPGSANTAIAMFAKAPHAGSVKTRLIGALSPEESARFHGACALSTWDRISGLPAIDVYLYCDRPWREFEAAAGSNRFRLQRGADLGERMRQCLDDLLALGYARALIVGSDAPTLPEVQIHEAIAVLGTADVVLGPSEDGGFTLIGAVRTVPAMFRGVAWSEGDTRESCLRAMRSAGLRAAPTQTRGYDVDTPADLERLRLDPALPERLRRWLDNQPARRS